MGCSHLWGHPTVLLGELMSRAHLVIAVFFFPGTREGHIPVEEVDQEVVKGGEAGIGGGGGGGGDKKSQS